MARQVPFAAYLLVFFFRYCNYLFRETLTNKVDKTKNKASLPDYFASAREAYESLACRNLCTVTLLLLCPDTGPAVRILGNIGALQKY